jgi:hypothetical protein
LEDIQEKAYELLRRGKHEESLNILEPLVREALNFYKDEMHIKMAKYYYALGTTILAKIENNNDVFGGA